MPVKATVAIAHTREKHRSEERVYRLVREAVDLLGGMSQVVKPGQVVLIKPNLTVYYSAEEGVTTDPLVVGALIRLAFEAGASRVQVAESSGDYFSTLECMRITGVAAIAEKYGAELIDLGSDRVPNRRVPIPKGEVLREVPLPEPLLDAGVIINACKAKNHHIEPISGALKNWVGVVNHRWREDHHGDEAMRKPGHEGTDYLPINLLAGSGVTLEGTLGHVKSAVDSMLRRGELNQVIWLRGTPTVFDDAALEAWDV